MIVLIGTDRKGNPLAKGVVGDFTLSPCKLQAPPNPLPSRLARRLELEAKNTFTTQEEWYDRRSEACLDYVWAPNLAGKKVLYSKKFHGAYDPSGIPEGERQNEAWLDGLNTKLDQQEAEHSALVGDSKVCTALVTGGETTYFQDTFEELAGQIRSNNSR